AQTLASGLDSPFLIVKDNQLEAAFTYAGDSPLMRLDEQGNAVYYLTDAIGSVIALVDGNGEKIADFSYDSFGNLQRSGELPLHLGGDFRFQGQWLESNTDFYHFRARYYDPQTGRFISRDPVEVIETVPQSSNPYQFVYHNPHVYTDPSGKYSLNELNVRQVMENILNQLRANISDTLKQDAIDRFRGLSGDLIGNFLKKVAPEYQVYASVLDESIDISRKTGDSSSLSISGEWIEELIIDIGLCPVAIDAGFGNFVWRETEIQIDGDVKSPGTPCGTPRNTGQSTSNPDIIISTASPDSLNAVQKAWLVADIKQRLGTIRNYVFRNKSQWQAMSNFAQRNQYVPIALYVTLFNDSAPNLIQDLKERALKDGVILSILPLVSK
ncbi:MAG: RHS repeat-associated core domain-containing protein, partial [Kamptonema sp. SIO1D9]|nr:RHS repeat-associated core domain-containing protein [Kamptonema sp. SIO1D9]